MKANEEFILVFCSVHKVRVSNLEWRVIWNMASGAIHRTSPSEHEKGLQPLHVYISVVDN